MTVANDTCNPNYLSRQKSLQGHRAKHRYRYNRHHSISISSSLYTSCHVSLQTLTIRLVFLRHRHVKTRGDLSPLLVKLVNYACFSSFTSSTLGPQTSLVVASYEMRTYRVSRDPPVTNAICSSGTEEPSILKFLLTNICLFMIVDKPKASDKVRVRGVYVKRVQLDMSQQCKYIYYYSQHDGD